MHIKGTIAFPWRSIQRNTNTPLSYCQTVFPGKSSSPASCWTFLRHLLIMTSSWECPLSLYHKTTLTNAFNFTEMFCLVFGLGGWPLWCIIKPSPPAEVIAHSVGTSDNNKKLWLCVRAGSGGRKKGEVDGIIVALDLCTVHKISLRHRTAGVITCHTTVFIITLEQGCGLIGFFVKDPPPQHALKAAHTHTHTHTDLRRSVSPVGTSYLHLASSHAMLFVPDF